MDGRVSGWMPASLVAIAAVFTVDQLTKLLTVFVHAPAVQPVRNSGVITGVTVGPRVVVIALTVLVLVLFAGSIGRWSLHIGIPPVIPAIVCGGIVAHVYDRVVFGSVRDFLWTGWLFIDLADIAVVAGIVALAVAFAFRMHTLHIRAQTIVLELPAFKAIVVDQKAA
jgi:lipoprotein signal peptidase